AAADRAGTPGPEATPALVAVEGVTARYGAGPAVLVDINLAVRRGETVAVVGESGSGKTSLARVICGLLPCAGGSARFGAPPLPATLRARPREQLRRIQMVYQMPDVALNPRQTVLDIVGRPVALCLGASRERVRSRAVELLGMVDL